MANLWFKFYGGEYLSDPKIERLSPIERSCWITILCIGSMGGHGIIKFLTVETLLNKSGIQFDPYHPEEWEKALSVLIKFQSMEMIELHKNGDIHIVNWEKRQEHNLTVAERVAKSRANKKHVTMNVTNVTTEENRIEKNREDKSMMRPQSLKEVIIEFSLKRSTQVEAEKFWNFYEANGWKVGKNPMKKWKAAVAGWISRSGEFKLKPGDTMRSVSNARFPDTRSMDKARAFDKRVAEEKEEEERKENEKNNDRIREVGDMTKTLANKFKMQ